MAHTLNPQRDIDTDKIERIAQAVAYHSEKSEAHDRISSVEEEVSKIKERLHEGDLKFQDIGGKIDTVISIGKWVLATVGTLTIAFIGSVFWFILQEYVKRGASI